MSPQPVTAEQVGRKRVMRHTCSACVATALYNRDTEAITTTATNDCNHDWTC